MPESGFRELAADLAELTVNVGLMDTIAGEWPPDVQERWEAKKAGIRGWALAQAIEIRQFAEFYDE